MRLYSLPSVSLSASSTRTARRYMRVTCCVLTIIRIAVSKDNERDKYYAVVYYCEEEAFFGIMAAVNPDSKVCGIFDGILDDVQKEKMKNFEVVGNIHEPDWKQYGKYFQEIEEEASND